MFHYGWQWKELQKSKWFIYISKEKHTSPTLTLLTSTTLLYLQKANNNIHEKYLIIRFLYGVICLKTTWVLKLLLRFQIYIQFENVKLYQKVVKNVSQYKQIIFKSHNCTCIWGEVITSKILCETTSLFKEFYDNVFTVFTILTILWLYNYTSWI